MIFEHPGQVEARNRLDSFNGSIFEAWESLDISDARTTREFLYPVIHRHLFRSGIDDPGLAAALTGLAISFGITAVEAERNKVTA